MTLHDNAWATMQRDTYTAQALKLFMVQPMTAADIQAACGKTMNAAHKVINYLKMRGYIEEAGAVKRGWQEGGERIYYRVDELVELTPPWPADWSKAPAWAEWHAWSRRGFSMWYEDRPEKHGDGWRWTHWGHLYPNYVLPLVDGHGQEIEGWAETLERRP